MVQMIIFAKQKETQTWRTILWNQEGKGVRDEMNWEIRIDIITSPIA